MYSLQQQQQQKDRKKQESINTQYMHMQEKEQSMEIVPEEAKIL